MRKCIICLLALLGIFSTCYAQQTEIDYTGLSKREERHLRRLYKDYDYMYGKHGYFGQVSVDATYYATNSLFRNNVMCGIDVVNGYSFGPLFDLGIGIGLHYIPSKVERQRYITIPLFAQARVTFIESKIAPYLAAKLGGAYMWDGDRERHNQGCLVTEGFSPYIGGELGVKIALQDGMAITVGLCTSLYFDAGVGLNVGFTW